MAHLKLPWRPLRPLCQFRKASITTNLLNRPSSILRTPVSNFTTSASLGAAGPPRSGGRKKGKAPKTDSRITNIRYHLFHPSLPRPLRFSRLRALRHWTIHRAWQMHRAKLNWQKERELERQYQSMARACEELRLMDENGMTVTESEAAQRNSRGEKNVGRLYRIAMLKQRVWGPKHGFPIEYARAQTDFPPREGWNHSWTR